MATTHKTTVKMMLMMNGTTLPFGPYLTYPTPYAILSRKIARPIEADVIG